MNNHTHHHNGSIVLKVTATITVIFLVAITLNQIILNRHINDTIEENMEETVLRTAEQTENYLSTRVSGSIERLLYFKAESGLDSILANYFANPNAAAYSVAMSNLAAPLSTKKVSDSLISDLYLYTDYGAFTDGSTLLTPGFSLEKAALCGKEIHFWSSAPSAMTKSSAPGNGWYQCSIDSVSPQRRCILPPGNAF